MVVLKITTNLALYVIQDHVLMRFFVGTVTVRIAHNAVSTEGGVMSVEKR